MRRSRRDVLKTMGAAAGVWLAAPAIIGRAPALAAMDSGRRLTVLPEIDATATGAFRLSAIESETVLAGAAASPTLGFNRPYLGPVVRVRRGTAVEAAVENRTSEPVSVHWHGLLIPGEVDGGPHNLILPGEVWRPTLDIAQGPATLWYHSHIHGRTGAQVYAGLAGVLLVEDGRDAERGLPVERGVDDLVLVLRDKRLDAAGRLAYEPDAADIMHGFLGNLILVNGAARPAARVPQGIVRLRLLNGANARNFDLRFADGRPFAIIASEQGYLPAPVVVDAVRLTPGERIELLVDFGEGSPAALVSLPHAESHGTMPMGGMMHDMLPLGETFVEPFPVMDFAVDRALPVAVAAMPQQFDAEEDTTASPSLTRRFVLNDMGMMMPGAGAPPGGHMGHDMHAGHGPATGRAAAEPAMVFGINNRAFDMRRLDHETALASTERWIVSGQMMGHPFHIHGARFRVESENGGPPRPENRGWKDTVFVEGEAVLRVRFDQPAPANHPFMFHCHILEHEDAGMMGQFSVV